MHTIKLNLTSEQLAQLRVAETTTAYTSREVMNDPEVVYKHLKHMQELPNEHVAVLTLNARSRLINKHIVSIGTVDSGLVHPREVFRQAITDNAVKIIVAHNHPSGDTTPSDDDLMVTKRLVTAGKVIGINVIDHIIIGDGYHSMQVQGQM